MKEHASTRAGIAQRAWALLLAVALCLGLVPGAAWAAEGQTAAAGAENAQASAGTVTLTVTAGSKNDYGTGEVTYPTWVNKQYALGEVLKTAQAAGGTGHGKGDLTMEDLLDTAVAKGDLKAYDASESSYGKYLNSVTSKDGAKLAGWSSDDSSTAALRTLRSTRSSLSAGIPTNSAGLRILRRPLRPTGKRITRRILPTRRRATMACRFPRLRP